MKYYHAEYRYISGKSSTMIKFALFMKGRGNLTYVSQYKYYIHRHKDKNHIIISIYAYKAFENPTCFHDKSRENRTGENRYQHNKGFI